MICACHAYMIAQWVKRARTRITHTCVRSAFVYFVDTKKCVTVFKFIVR